MISNKAKSDIDQKALENNPTFAQDIMNPKI